MCDKYIKWPHTVQLSTEGETGGLLLMPIIPERVLDRQNGLSCLPAGLVFGLPTDTASRGVKDLLL